MGETVTFASNGGTCEGYLATPGGRDAPGVVVIQEWWGLVPHVERVVDRLAASGFVALAPDLYHGEQTTEPDLAGKLMMGLDVAAVAQDLVGAVDFLVSRDDTVGEGVGVVGFCMGGGLTLLAGTLSPHVVAASAFYPATPWSGYDPDWSQYAGKELIVHAAESDGGTAAENIQAAATAAKAAGGIVTLHDYPGSHHAFFNDDRPEVYDRDDAELAWRRTVELFARRLGA